MDHPVLTCSLLHVRIPSFVSRGTFVFPCAARLSWDHSLLFILQMTDEDECMEWHWVRGKPVCPKKYMTSCHFAQEKAHVDRPGIELGAYVLRGQRLGLYHGRMSTGIQFRVACHSVGTADFPIYRGSCEAPPLCLRPTCHVALGKFDGFENFINLLATDFFFSNFSTPYI